MMDWFTRLCLLGMILGFIGLTIGVIGKFQVDCETPVLKSEIIRIYDTIPYQKTFYLGLEETEMKIGGRYIYDFGLYSEQYEPIIINGDSIICVITIALFKR